MDHRFKVVTASDAPGCVQAFLLDGRDVLKMGFSAIEDVWQGSWRGARDLV